MIKGMVVKRPTEVDGVAAEVDTLEADSFSAPTKAEELMEAMWYLPSENSAPTTNGNHHRHYAQNTVARNLTIG